MENRLLAWHYPFDTASDGMCSVAGHLLATAAFIYNLQISDERPMHGLTSPVSRGSDRYVRAAIRVDKTIEQLIYSEHRERRRGSASLHLNCLVAKTKAMAPCMRDKLGRRSPGQAVENFSASARNHRNAARELTAPSPGLVCDDPSILSLL